MSESLQERLERIKALHQAQVQTGEVKKTSEIISNNTNERNKSEISSTNIEKDVSIQEKQLETYDKKLKSSEEMEINKIIMNPPDIPVHIVTDDFFLGNKAKNQEKLLESKENATKKKDEKLQKKQKTTLRKCAGVVWQDNSLLDWPEDDYRLYCGNLGNQVKDDTLANAFIQYQSFSRAKVIRDQRSQKSKGYGFISLQEPSDFLRALKQMDGKYIGNRPVQLLKSKWVQRSYNEQKDDGLGQEFQLGKPTKKVKKIPISNL